jgi:YVTN family beta-propeller protein
LLFVLRRSAGIIPVPIDVGNAPAGDAANPDTNRIFVANTNNNTVLVVDGATNHVMSTARSLSPP